LRDLVRRCAPGGVVPPRDPVDGAEDRECHELRVAAGEQASPHAVAQHLPESTVDPIASGDDLPEQRRCQGVHFKRPRRAVQHVDEQVNEGDDQPVQLAVRCEAGLLDIFQFREDQAERVIVAGEEDLFLVAEVVVQVAWSHVERGRDLVDARSVEAATAEQAGGRPENLDAFARAARAVAIHGQDVLSGSARRASRSPPRVPAA
jgi:hypothetical protein